MALPPENLAQRVTAATWTHHFSYFDLSTSVYYLCVGVIPDNSLRITVISVSPGGLCSSAPRLTQRRRQNEQ